MKKVNFKKMAIIAIAVMMSVAANAQLEDITYGIRAGVNFTSITGDFMSGYSMSNKTKSGIQLGVVEVNGKEQ